MHTLIWSGAAAAAGVVILACLPAQALAQAVDVPEVVVTAERRPESLQRVPVSITALTGETLERAGAQTVLDVAAHAPNVTVRLAVTGSGQSAAAFIRGVGQSDWEYAYSPRVGLYLDDVYFATMFGSVVDLLDLDRVEVLRGPQGTLFGRNAAGGAVRLFSKAPTDRFEGYVEGSAGDEGQAGVKGAVNLPLVAGKAMARLSAGYRRSDGWVDLIDWPCRYPQFAGAFPARAAGGDCKVGELGGSSAFSARGQLRVTPGGGIEDLVSVDYSRVRAEAPPDVLTAPANFTNRIPDTGEGDPTLASGLAIWMATIGGPRYGMPFFGGGVAGVQLGALRLPIPLPPAAFQASLYAGDARTSYAAFANPGGGYPGEALSIPNANDIDSWGVSNTLDLDLGRHVHLRSITAARGYDGRFGVNQPSLPLPIEQAVHDTSHHQFSQELILSGAALGGRLDWTAGAFLLDTGDRDRERVQIAGLALVGAPYDQDVAAEEHASLRNRSAFAHGVLRLAGPLSLEAGVRYSHETRTDAFSNRYLYYLGLPPALFPDFTRPTASSDGRWTPRLALDVQASPLLMLYAAYSTGFTAGGFNGRPVGPDDVFPFKPETLATYEAGFKGEWLGRRLRLNGAAFFTDYRDVQITLFCVGRPGCPHPTTLFWQGNGGDAHVKGFELEAEARPAPGWLVTAAVGYTGFRYVRLDPTAFGVTIDSPQVNVPKWTASLGAQYDIGLGSLGVLTPRLDVAWQSAVYFDASRPDDPADVQPGYALVGARLSWRPARSPWLASVAVSNLADTLYYSFKFDSREAFGYATGTVGAPRRVSASLRRSF